MGKIEQWSRAQRRQGRCGLTLLFFLQMTHLVEKIVAPVCVMGTIAEPRSPYRQTSGFGSGTSAEALPLLHALAFVAMRDTMGACVYICSNSWVTKKKCSLSTQLFSG